MNTTHSPACAPTLLIFALSVIFPAALAGQSPDNTETPAVTPSTQLVASAGIFSTDGNIGKSQQDLGYRKSGYGGIEQFHYGKDIDDTLRIAIDGRLLAGQEDYLFGLKITKDEILALDLGFKQFRTWYDGSPGYYAPTGAFYSQYSDNILHTDRGSIWFSIATLFPERPNVTLRYERNTRRGTKSSTILGTTTQPGAGAKSIGPAYYDLDEKVDILTLDVAQQTDNINWGAGVRYQHETVDNNLYSTRDLNTATPGLSDTNNKTSTDLFSAHAYVSGHAGKKLTYAAGGLVTSLDTDIGGSRIIYSGADPLYDPGARTITSVNVIGLGGGSKYKQYVGDANIAWRPTKNWVVVPAIRMEDYRIDNVSEYMAALPGATPPPALRHIDSNNKWFEVSEAIEARYTGYRNWTHTLKAELMQGTGSLYEKMFDNFTGPDSVATLNRDTDQHRYTQKYSYSANWYAKPGLTFAGQYYYKYNRNYNDTPAATDTTTSAGNRYPAWIAFQGFDTHDVNIRATWRPLATLSLVTRYDYQLSRINSASRSGAFQTPRAEGSRSATHIISENITFTPHPRLYILANASLTYDQITSPAVEASGGAIKNSDNNYMNAGLTALFVASDMDDLSLEYTFYRTDNYIDNSALGLPYGGKERQHVAALSWTRRLTAWLNYTVRYTYADYTDKATGGHMDYRANGIYARIQYMF